MRIKVKIPIRQFFTGPNMVELHRIARIVVSETPSPLAFLDMAVTQKTEAILRDVLGHRAAGVTFHATSLADLIGEIIIFLQQANRQPVKRFSITPLSKTTVEISFEITRESVLNPLLSCLETLLEESRSLAPSGSFKEIYTQLERKLRYQLDNFISDDQCFAARRLGVSVRHKSRGTIYLGEGYLTRLLGKGFTEATKRLGYRLTADKIETADLLQSYGLPTPRQQEAETIDQALRAAHKIGYPVVVKPRRGNKGRGISVDVRTDEQMAKAYGYAEDEECGVLVESFIPGTDHRLLVVNGQFIAAVQRIPAKVCGDGIHRISELMELLNRLEQRDGLYLFPLVYDGEVEQTLAKQEMTLDSIPENGRIVFLRGASNQSLGGTTEDVTDLVHPDNRAAAIAAAEICMLDIAGVDFVIPDISQSWRTVGGGIVEVNAGPGVDLHMAPTAGKSRNISHKLVRTLFPADAPSFITTILVAGRTRKKIMLRQLSAILPLLGYQPGIYLGGKAIVRGQQIYSGGYQNAVNALLDHRGINAVVAECSPSFLKRFGSVLESTSITVLTDSEWFADPGSRTDEHPLIAQRLQRMLVDIAREGVVIDATQPALRSVVADLPPWQTLYVWAAQDIDTMPLDKHLEAGGQALTIEPCRDRTLSLVFRRGREATPLALLTDLHEKSISQLREIMLTCGVLICLGWRSDLLRTQCGTLWKRGDFSDSSLTCCRKGNGWFAVCDPTDSVGIQRLTDLCGSLVLQGLWIILPDGTFIAQHITDLARLFAPLRPEWCCTGPNSTHVAETLQREGIGAHFIHRFDRSDTAVDILAHRDAASLMCVLLSIDISERDRFLRPPNVPRSSVAEQEELLSPARLARNFSGVWVGGAIHGWIADGITWGDRQIRPGDVVVFPKLPDDPEQGETGDAGIFEAFERGARAVITSNHPPDLQRWLPLLVCDSPEIGLDRLASEARTLLRGTVVAFSDSGGGVSLSRLHKEWSRRIETANSIYLDEVASPPDIPVSRQIALSLCRTPPDVPIALYPLNWDKLAFLLVQPALWIVAIRNDQDESTTLEILNTLPSNCMILACIADSLLSGWQEISTRFPSFSWLIIPLEESFSNVAATAHSLTMPARQHR